MAEVEQSCRTCTFLHAFTPNGKRRAVKGQQYRCDAPLPMPLAFPESVVRSLRYAAANSCALPTKAAALPACRWRLNGALIAPPGSFT